MKLTFFGAAQEVTGSCTLLESSSSKILVDCGLFQGADDALSKNQAEFGFDPKSIAAVVVTHAHIDHIGRIPLLVKRGFSGRIFATPATKLLMKIMWRDAVEVLKSEARKKKIEPLYKLVDANAAGQLIVSVDYGQKQNITPELNFTFHNSGHIFGSAFVEIFAENKIIVFSGDLGLPGIPILKDPERLSLATVLVLESTYGDRNRPDPSWRSRELAEAINDLIARRGVMVIPAFSLERTQEILYELSALFEQRRMPNVPVFLDSPLAEAAIPIYKKFKNLWDEPSLSVSRRGLDFFDFPNLKIIASRADGPSFENTPAPKIIMAASGMIHGGKVTNYVAKFLPDSRNMILIVGYQSAHTVGRALLDGQKSVRLNGQMVPVVAEIRKADAYSAHADQHYLLTWTQNLPKTSRIILNHGELAAAQSLAKLIQNKLDSKIVIPNLGETIEL